MGCEGSEVELWCEEGTVISVIRANYGRISSSVCADTGRHQTWSTRCIQPRTLREVTSRCSSGDSQCSLQVSSQVFGDPCPDTPKYLEVVYTCQSQSSKEATRDLNIPPWLLSLETMTDIIMKKVTTSTTTQETTLTITSTSSTTSPPPIRLSGDYIRRPSQEFLLYIKQMEQRKKKERMEQFLNRPVVTLHQEPREQSDNTVLVAALISVITVVTILTLTLIIITLRRRRRSVSKTEEESSDSESTTSSTSTYLQYSVQGSDYSYVMGRDGRIYQVISQLRPASIHGRPTSSVTYGGQNNEYEDVDKISVIR